MILPTPIDLGTFRPWPKIPRLKDSNVVITEKIDGTNAAVVVQQVSVLQAESYKGDNVLFVERYEGNMTPVYYAVCAQSRTRIITPTDDNFGFAGWVWDNPALLVQVLGIGYHYGEWWGSGIQRGYGLEKGEKRFSLFNTGRWHAEEFNLDIADNDFYVPGLGVVPVLATTTGTYMMTCVKTLTEEMLRNGSHVVRGFMKPEGLVVYHTAAKQSFKVLFEGDGKPKGAQA